MNKYQSDKLRTISFFLILLVVMVHSTNLSVRIDANFTTINKGVNSFFQNFISDGIAKIASPLFFAISGYLFFLNINEGKPAEFLEKYKKRFRTLVIPYLLWSIFGLIFYFAIQSIPYFKPFFTREDQGLLLFSSVDTHLPAAHPLSTVVYKRSDSTCINFTSHPLAFKEFKKFNCSILSHPLVSKFQLCHF